MLLWLSQNVSGGCFIFPTKSKQKLSKWSLWTLIIHFMEMSLDTSEINCGISSLLGYFFRKKSWRLFGDILVLNIFWRYFGDIFVLGKFLETILTVFWHILEICGTTIRQEYLDIISIHPMRPLFLISRLTRGVSGQKIWAKENGA